MSQMWGTTCWELMVFQPFYRAGKKCPCASALVCIPRTGLTEISRWRDEGTERREDNREGAREVTLLLASCEISTGSQRPVWATSQKIPTAAWLRSWRWKTTLCALDCACVKNKVCVYNYAQKLVYVFCLDNRYNWFPNTFQKSLCQKHFWKVKL